MTLWARGGAPLNPGDHVLIPAKVIACGDNFCELEYWPRGSSKGLMDPSQLYRFNEGDPQPDPAGNIPDRDALKLALGKEIFTAEERIEQIKKQLEGM